MAFAGRSNAGKSSVLNRLTRRRALARTSKTPGRTQLINFFGLKPATRLVDLPGYGFAKAPVAVQNRWAETVTVYLQRRSSLKGLVLVMDVRRPLQSLDLQLIDWCGDLSLSLHLLLNKADKLGRGAASRALLETRQTLEAQGYTATAQLFCATQGDGLPELGRTVCAWLEGDGGDLPP